MKRMILQLVAPVLLLGAAAAQPVTTKPSLIDMLTANCGAGRAIVGSAGGPACSGLTFSGSGTVAFGSGGTVLYAQFMKTRPNP
jgi:hypothetical protein